MAEIGAAAASHTHNYVKHVAKAENECIPEVVDSFQSFRCTTSTTGFGDGYIMSQRWSSGNYITQLFTEVDPSYALLYRYRDNGGTWGTWKRIPMGDGTGASGTWGISISGNASTATKLQTARTINGTSFDGSANITTANWGTARTLTIGATGKSVNGSANVSWTLAEIGAAAASHTHDYLFSKQETATQDNVTWAVGYAKTHRRAFIYNTSGTEWSYLFGLSNSNTVINSENCATYGAILKMGYTDRYLRMIRIHGGCWYNTSGTKNSTAGDTTNVSWEKIYAGYADSAGSVAWGNVTSKPATATRWPAWSEVTSKPGSTGSANQPVYWNGSTFVACTAYSSASVSYASSAGSASSVAWGNVTSKPSLTGSATQPVYWNGSGFTACTAYSSASVNYATTAGSATNATYTTHLNASYLVGSSNWNWNPFSVTQYWCWGESFINSSMSSDSGDLRFYLAPLSMSGGAGLCMNIDGYISTLSQIRADNGFIHGGHNNNNAVLLAGGSWKLLSNFYIDYQTDVKSYYNGTYTTLNTGGYLIDFSSYTGSLIHFQLGGSTSGLDICMPHYSGTDIYIRKTVDSNRFERTSWTKLITTDNISSYVSSSGGTDNTKVAKAGDTMTGQLYINYDYDVGLDQNGSLVIGNKAGINLAIDGNEIMARNNSSASILYLNSEGGTVSLNSTGGSTGIGTASPSYKLHVSGDSYTTGWSRAASGFYCEGYGVHYTHRGITGIGELYLSGNNEYCIGSSTSSRLWFNYRAAGNGNTITEYRWGAGSSSSYATFYVGNFYAVGGTFYVNSTGAYHTSDVRKKYDIYDILNKDVINLFNTENAYIRHFKWKDTNSDAYGFIAQELQEYCPEAVNLSDEGYYSVNYNVAFSKIIGAMYKKIKELEKRLEEK